MIGIAGCVQAPFVVQRRLNNESVPCLEFFRPLGADFHNFPAELMTYYDGIFRHISRDALMSASLFCCFIGRSAEAVRNYPCKNLVFFHLRQFKLFHPEIHFPV